MTDQAGAAAPGAAGGLRQRLRRLGPVLYATLLTTLGGYCLAALLSFTGVAQVDVLSWRLLAAVAVPLASGGAGDQPIAVVLIGDRYFEREFQQSSPLNRAELARVVSAIEAGVASAERPVVAIDFDLSPAARPDARQQKDQAELDRALLSLAHQATVVLLCPFAVTEALREEQLRWARDLVTRAPPGRIVLARPDLQVQAGAVLSFAAESPSLGRIAGDAVRRIEGRTKPSLLAACTEPAPRTTTLAKINFAGYRAYRSVEIDSQTPLADLLRMDTAALVMLGGSYALAADEFSTAAGERLRGVEMHAAVAYSRIQPIGPVPALLDPLLQYTVVLLVALLAKRAARWVFANMRAPMPPDEEAAAAPRWRWLWGVPGAGHPTYEAVAWTRWLVGLVLLLGVFLIFLLGFGAISLALMLLFGLWYDFLFMALVSFGKTCSVELRRMLDDMSLHDGGATPADLPQSDAIAPYVLPFGIGLRVLVLLVGGGVLIDKLVALAFG